MKNLKIAFSVLLAVLLIASCTQVRFVEMIPDDGDKKETPISDLPKIVDPETILKDAANRVEGLSYKVESSSEAFASRAAGDAESVYYQMVVSFRGYESANGIISRGTLTFNFEQSPDGDGYEYTANGNGLVVASSTDASTRRTDAEGLAGTVKGFSFIEDGKVSVTPEFAVDVNPYKGSFTSGRDKVTIAESKGVVSGGNGTADSPFIISDLKTLEYINEFGDNVSFQLGADFINLSEPITIKNKNITLELNGHTLSATGNIKVIKVDGGSLTINGNGSIEATAEIALHVFNDGSAIINGGHYISSNDSGIGVGSTTYSEEKKVNIACTGGKLIVNGGKVDAREYGIGVWGDGELIVNDVTVNTVDNIVIGTNGTGYDLENDYPYPEYSITINGGTFNGHIISDEYIACGIYAANAGSVVLNGGTFNIYDGVGILVRGGELDIRNTEINLIQEEGRDSGKVGDSRIILTSNAPVVVDKEASKYPAEDTIKVLNAGGYEIVYLDKDGNPKN